MSKITDRYEPKLYETDQTRYALTPAMERLLLKDHLCFQEEIITKIDNKDICRILTGYLQYRRDQDPYLLGSELTEAFEKNQKRRTSSYRMRFGRELTDMICSFDFSREEGFDARILVEKLLSDYCSLPYAEREKIYFYETYLTIMECIRDQTELQIRVRSVPGDVRAFTYKPCLLCMDENSLLCYLAGYSREAGKGGKFSIYAVRLQRIISAYNTKEESNLTKDKQTAIQERIDEFGIAYINQAESEPITVALTENGYLKYLKIMLHQRPLPSEPVEAGDAEFPYILKFQCSHYQIENYFFSFGADAKILSPPELADRFAARYAEAAARYDSKAYE